MVFCAAIAALALSPMSDPVSAEGPAVSSLNGKITGFGGTTSSSGEQDGVSGVAGSLTMPLGYHYGLQLDGAYARVGPGNFGSTGAHLFWRDPTVGLIGLYGGYAYLDRFGGQELGRAGAEAQKFYGQMTIDTALGWRFGNDMVDDRIYARARLQYYLTNDLMLMGGYVRENRDFGTVGIEYQITNSKTGGLALFGEAQFNDRENYTAVAGVKMFIGESLSLKDRHRRQDPDSYSGVDIQATQEAAGIASRRTSSPQVCPFTPSSQLCTLASLQLPSVLPAKGLKFAAAPSSSRQSQCSLAGYSAGSPGPAACGCAEVFSLCSFPT